jgi:hypothetical protein
LAAEAAGATTAAYARTGRQVSEGAAVSYYDAFQHPIGSIVTRTGSDRWRVIKTNATKDSPADLIEVECIREATVEYCDGTFGESFCKVGDVTSFTADRLAAV